MTRKVAHSLAMVLLVIASVILLAASWTLSTAVMITATTALIMGGTGLPTPGPDYMKAMTNNFVVPFFDNAEPVTMVPVTTPEQFFPTDGSLTFDESVRQGVIALETAIGQHEEPLIIVGYSQSTRIATITKRNIIADAEAQGGQFEDYPDISFALVSNVNKPNGGILQRLSPFGGVPLLGITFDGATPTNSPENPDQAGDYALDTRDYTYVHDGWSDFPVYPLNVLALANALAGIHYLHGTYPDLENIGPDNPDVFYQGSYGDTDYYVLRTDIVPLLMPLQQLGVPRPILLFVDEPLRVLIETGYEREISPGQPTTVGLIPLKNPIVVVVNLARSVPVGFDDAAEDLGAGRPLGTEPSGPFGVGGPTGPIPDPTETSTLTTQNDAALVTGRQAAPASVVPQQSQPEPDKSNVVTEQAQEVAAPVGNESSATPPTTRRAPLRSLVRGPIGADRPVTRTLNPSGERPLQKVVDRLTGERPGKSTRDSQSSTGEPADGAGAGAA